MQQQDISFKSREKCLVAIQQQKYYSMSGRKKCVRRPYFTSFTVHKFSRIFLKLYLIYIIEIG